MMQFIEMSHVTCLDNQIDRVVLTNPVFTFTVQSFPPSEKVTDFLLDDIIKVSLFKLL